MICTIVREDAILIDNNNNKTSVGLQMQVAG